MPNGGLGAVRNEVRRRIHGRALYHGRSTAASGWRPREAARGAWCRC